MQETFHAVHKHNDGKCNGPEDGPHNEGWDNCAKDNCTSTFGCHDSEDTNILS